MTNALVGAVNTGIPGTENLSMAMGTLNGIVGAGNMRMADLTDAIATGILPTAKSMGLTLTDVGAALADMTDQGVPAADAATRLRMTFSLMEAPTSKATKAFEAIGMTSTTMANDMRQPNGLLVALTDLQDHLTKSGLSAVEQSQVISAAFGGGRTSSTILTLLGSLDRLDSKYKAITGSTKAFGNAWDSTALNVDERRAMLGAGIDALKIQLGDQLLPVEGKVLDALTQLAGSPEVTQGIADFGTALAGMFTDSNIASAEKFVADIIPGIKDFATSVLPPLEEGLKITGQAAKAAFDMFMALPEPVKAAVIAALAANKLTGGLVASGLGDLAKVAMGGGGVGGGGGIVGGLGVQKVFVVNMAEGMGMGGGAAASGSSMLSVAVRSIIPVAIAAASIYALAETWQATFAPGGAVSVAQTATDQQIAAWTQATTPLNDNVAALQAVVKTYNDNTGNIILSTLNANAANVQYGEAFVAAADKIAGGSETTTQGIQAIKDAIAVERDLMANTADPEKQKQDQAVIDRLSRDLEIAEGLPVVTPQQAARDATIAAAAYAAQTKPPVSHDTSGVDSSKQVAALQAAADAMAHDTSGQDMHAAAQTLDSAVTSWRNATLPALGQDIRMGFQGLNPTPVNVTVNTVVSIRDINNANVHSQGYRTAVPV